MLVSYNIIKSYNCMINHMTSHIIDFIRSEQFNIIIDSKVNFSFIINVILWSHMTCHVIDPNQSEQFHMIIYLEIDFLLIINHLTYLTFLISNFYNLSFELIYILNLLNQSISTLPLACNILFPQTYIHKKIYSYLLSYL